MDKVGLLTLIVGIILLIVGIAAIWYFLPQAIEFVKGGIGICLALAGLGAMFLGAIMLKD